MLFRTLVSIFLTAALAWAQHDWSVVRALPPETKVEIHLSDSRPRGKIVSVTDEQVTLATKKGEQTYARTDVKRVKIPSRTKRLLWGSIGVAAGATTGALICAHCSNEGDTTLMLQLMAIGAAAGALAFLIPGYKTIYKTATK